ncbi:MAG: hypothetical protein JSW60_02205 [Thermoplasmatales archaeon]|nr:MAG: hypothetical protein JSW60_02205 [Thermoplasmatales archaeon]
MTLVYSPFMVRVGRLRNFIHEFAESPLIEKISFVLPFFVIVIDIVILEHAIRIKEAYIIMLTTLLFFLSVFEIAVVTGEIHGRYQKSNFQRTLTIKLDDFIIERKKNNVKKIVEEFTEIYPRYRNHRNEVYHITCQIMETHKEEALEKALTDKLKKFIKRRKKMNVDDTLEVFIKKYPIYKNYRAEVYKKTCQIKGLPEENKFDG